MTLVANWVETVGAAGFAFTVSLILRRFRQTDRPGEFATSVNSRIMSRKVTEHPDQTALASTSTPVDGGPSQIVSDELDTV